MLFNHDSLSSANWLAGICKTGRTSSTSLQALPALGIVSQDELLYFIDHHRLMGSGIGLVDMHLLAASRLAGVPLWTEDRGLGLVARRLGQAYSAGG